MRAKRSCEGPTGIVLKLDPEGTRFKYEYELCPVNYIEIQMHNWVYLFMLFKDGKLLEPGGIGDQPAKYMDVMTFLQNIWVKAEREAMEKTSVKGRR